MDTRDKRSSAIHVSLPWRGFFPVPDGALSQADRQHVCLMYRGIAAGAAVPSFEAPADIAISDATLWTVTAADATFWKAVVSDAALWSMTLQDE